MENRFNQMTINCRGKILDLSSPLVMGILNLTPDSFYDGGKWKDNNYLSQVEKMLSEGASVIDIGGMSSRPGSEFVAENEEIKRIVQPVKNILKEFPDVVISIDSWRSSVVKAVADCGIQIVNDISGGDLDEKLLMTVAEFKLPYILMHMKGTPKDMQKNIENTEPFEVIADYFIKKIEILESIGISDIIIDPGFGFGKTLTQNYKLLMGLNNFNFLGKPIMVGISRKSMIYNILSVNSADSLNGTTSVHVLALERGAKILRVHDVKEAVETIKIWNFCKNLL
jgi:dihydropteroate synthase